MGQEKSKSMILNILNRNTSDGIEFSYSLGQEDTDSWMGENFKVIDKTIKNTTLDCNSNNIVINTLNRVLGCIIKCTTEEDDFYRRGIEEEEDSIIFHDFFNTTIEQYYDKIPKNERKLILGIQKNQNVEYPLIQLLVAYKIIRTIVDREIYQYV